MRYEGEQKSHRPAKCKCSDCDTWPSPRSERAKSTGSSSSWDFLFVHFLLLGYGGWLLLSLSFFFFGISPSATAAAAVFGTRVTPTLLATDPFQPHPAGLLASRVPCRWGCGPPKKRNSPSCEMLLQVQNFLHQRREKHKSVAVGGAARCQ
jgi:hypothetical protein